MSPGPIPASTLDHLLTAQLAVAWAGEGGESPRLSWWRTDLCSEFGGEDLFARLAPSTWRWATLQGVREAARRADAAGRARDADPDRLRSIFHLGQRVDSRLDERLADHKRSGNEPAKALPGLAALLNDPWSAARFAEWVQARSPSRAEPAPAGRRLAGAPPADLRLMVDHLVAALAPLSEHYPLPHYRISA
jgi:hypothetical protein